MYTVTTGLTNLGGIVGASTGLGGLPLQFGGDLLGLAILFFILAIVAAVVGARGVAGITMEIARILIVVFLILAVISLLL